MQNNLVKLISIFYPKDEYGHPQTDEAGNQISIETVTEVWAEITGVRQSEFYNAAAAGLKPELTFIIWANEYTGQTKIEYNDVKYRIMRTYINPVKSEMIELICEKVIADG